MIWWWRKLRAKYSGAKYYRIYWGYTWTVRKAITLNNVDYISLYGSLVNCATTDYEVQRLL